MEHQEIIGQKRIYLSKQEVKECFPSCDEYESPTSIPELPSPLMEYLCKQLRLGEE